MPERVEVGSLWPSENLPRVLLAPAPGADVGAWFRTNRATMEGAVMEHGAVLLRGFPMSGAQFARLTRGICGHAEPYVYRSTPRTSVGANIYTASEYAPSETIPMHCENAYQRSWPMRLLFWCDVPANVGGETPLADVNKVTSRIPASICDEFAARNVLYVRNYSNELDLPWQVVFQTSDRATVERYCRHAEIDYEWKANGDLRTKQVCQALARHPNTGSLVWFNQAQLFHVSSLSRAARESLLASVPEEELPRNAYFGDGGAIPPQMLAEVSKAFDAERVAFAWQAGDVLVLDNMRVAHGRNPYAGRRRVLVGMGLVHRPTEEPSIQVSI